MEHKMDSGRLNADNTTSTKLYAAPMEGLTGFVWRMAHDSVFGGCDKYFAPFISPRSSEKLTTRELRDLTNSEPKLVPQILANNGEHFLWGAHALMELGYKEINFNLGCPSGTVVAKGKGSGALRDPAALDCMLNEIFETVARERLDVPISVKTRVGYDSTEKWDEIMAVYEQYPISELIIHPRVGKQQYRGLADRELFLDTLERHTGRTDTSTVAFTERAATTDASNFPIIYNGDVNNCQDPAFEYGNGCSYGVMVGRGLIADPAMFRQVRGGEPASREELKEFHQLMVDGYLSYMPGPMPMLHRMKEFWLYYSNRFEIPENMYKKMLKSKKLDDFMHYTGEILENCELNTEKIPKTLEY